MPKIDVLLTEARIGFSQAPDPSITSALLRSAEQFCRQSSIWRQTLDPITLATGIDAYDLDAPTGSRVERVLSLRLGGRRADMSQARFEDLHAAGAKDGRPSHFALTADGTQIVFWPTPTAEFNALAVELYAVLVPIRTARELPELLVDEWHDAIVAGARAEMFDNKQMPWFDPAMAANARMKFDAEVARARREQLSGQHTQLRVQPRAWI